MAVLIAQGRKFEDRWRRHIAADQTFLLGRSTCSFRVPWDSKVSKEHVRLTRLENALKVEKLSSATNPVFYRGKEVKSFYLQPGEHFVIGSTTFFWSLELAHVTLETPNPIHQRRFSSEFLQQLKFRDAEKRIDVLNRLPDVISSSSNDEDLLNRMTNTLLAGMPTASKVGFVRFDAQSKQTVEVSSPSATQTIKVDSMITIIHWDQRAEKQESFQPSGSLIRQAISSDQTILHQWQSYEDQRAEFTVDLQNDWAFVCPISSHATPGWAIYVAGRQRNGKPSFVSDSQDQEIQADIKFCQLVGSILVNLMQVKQLERRQASLRSFFSPIVMEALVGRDPDEVLAPQKCNVSVMFCDLRGFSKTSEAMGDELFQLLNRVSRSLDVMTGEILKQGGVIGDFHGDAAMGFWGWPLKQSNTAKQAISTSLAIENEFRQLKSTELDFQIAIGIASGPCVAGKIGSQDQVKVTVFGPVVNLASRLEGMNRWLNSSILADRATLVEFLKGEQPENMSWQNLDFRWRSMGLFQPYGMQSRVEVFQILNTDDLITDQDLVCFDQALRCFQAGDWDRCKELLKSMPEKDAGKLFLQSYMQLNSRANWSGVVKLGTK